MTVVEEEEEEAACSSEAGTTDDGVVACPRGTGTGDSGTGPACQQPGPQTACKLSGNQSESPLKPQARQLQLHVVLPPALYR